MTPDVFLVQTEPHYPDAVYPPGLRLGMVPLVGLNTAKTFPGFESDDGNVKVLITELPPAAYGEVVVIAARLEPGDVPEDIAADRLAQPLVAPLLARSRAATGRVRARKASGSDAQITGKSRWLV